MLNLSHVEDAWLQANAEIQEEAEKFKAEWMRPLIMTQIGLMAGTMTPREIQFVDPGTRETLARMMR